MKMPSATLTPVKVVRKGWASTLCATSNHASRSTMALDFYQPVTQANGASAFRGDV